MNGKTTLPLTAGLTAILSLLCFFLTVPASAQTAPRTVAVSGQLTDATTRQPLRSATISLLRKDSSVLAATSSREDGTFHITYSGKGPLLLRITAIGYQPLVRPLSPGTKESLALGVLKLKPEAAQLQTVVVMGERSAFKTEIDKKVFNVDRSLASKGGTAADALRQVPTINVDATGQVTLRNGAPVILVDGKTTDLTLDQIPSDQIQTIEVIPNPSARYDAQGNSGIVNIVMKRNRKPGMNGSVTGVWSSLRELYGFLNGNLYQGRWNFTVNYMGHRHRSVLNTNSDLLNLDNNSSVHQEGRTVRTGPFNKLRLGADFFMDAHNTFSLFADVGHGFHPEAGYQDATYRNPAGQTDSTSHRINTSADHFTFSHSEFGYTHNFHASGEKLTASAALETWYGPTTGSYSMQYLSKGGTPSGTARLQQFSGYGRAHNLTFQTDYTVPLRKDVAKLEAGLKTILHTNRSANDFQDFDPASGQYLKNNYASYNYQYDNNTYAAYTSYSDRIGANFSYMAGLRFEQYDYTGALPDVHTGFSFHNTGFYPSLFLTQKTGENGELHLNYSRRVNRPQWWQVSPWTDYTNPQNPQVGNPHIQSENTNLAEMAWNWNKGGISLNTTLYFKNTNDPIISYMIPLSNDTLLSTFKNARHANTWGSEIVYKMPLTKWWSTTANLNLYQASINADNLSQGLSNDGFSWFAKLNSEMKLAGLYTVQLTGNYNAANVVAQGKSLASGTMDIAVKRDLLKNNAGTLVISLSDIFNTLEYRTITSSSSFIQRAAKKQETRVLKINFSYAFGKERNGERKKTTSESTD